MRKILYSGFRHDHHTAGSGYDLMVPVGAAYVCGNDLPFGKKKIGSKLRSLNFLLVDILTFFRGIFYKNIHLIYPENTAYFSAILLEMLGKNVIFTIHLSDEFWIGQASSIFYKLKQLNLQFADSIITLSAGQQERMQLRFPAKRVLFLRHGVEFESTPPSREQIAQRKSLIRLIVVGSNYRDFKTLQAIAQNLRKFQVQLHLVGTGLSIKDFADVDEYVVVHGRLSAVEYDELLESCFAMVLPLTFATANNALLEAHKFAVPVLCSDIEGVRDYATSNTRFFLDANEFWNELSEMLNLRDEDYVDLCVRGRNDAAAVYDWRALRLQAAHLYID